MTTKREIVYAALEELGLGVYAFDPSADELNAALKRLDRLAAQWESIGIRLGYLMPSTPNGSDLDDESGLPDTAIAAYAANLALSIAPTVGKTVQPQTFKSAKDGYNSLLISRGAPPEMQHQNMLPVGAGNKPLAKDRQYFNPDDRLSTGDDELTY